MISYETFCRLRQLRDEQGLKVAQIAAQLDLDRKTVAAWIERATYQQRQGKRRASKRDAFKAQIKTLLKRQLKTYLRPELLLLDELGYLPIDQHGADLLFQVISQRYERGSIVLTTNKPFKQWPSIFNNDSTIASAVLDRLLHHAQTIVIEGSSYRMKDRENQ